MQLIPLPQAFGTFALTASSRHSLQDVCNILDRHYLGERTALAEMAIKRLEWKERREKKPLKAVKCAPIWAARSFTFRL
jgi:hypothetical protein